MGPAVAADAGDVIGSGGSSSGHTAASSRESSGATGPLLLQALHTLYTSTDSGERRRADAWLRNWQKTPEAWEVSVHLLVQDLEQRRQQQQQEFLLPDEAFYLLAQTLRSKTMFDFHELPAHAHETLCTEVLRLLQQHMQEEETSVGTGYGHSGKQQSSGRKAAIVQLSLCLADLALQTAQQWRSPVETILQACWSQPNNSSSMNTTALGAGAGAGAAGGDTYTGTSADASVPTDKQLRRPRLLLLLLQHLAEERNNRRVLVDEDTRAQHHKNLAAGALTVAEALLQLREQLQRERLARAATAAASSSSSSSSSSSPTPSSSSSSTVITAADAVLLQQLFACWGAWLPLLFEFDSVYFSSDTIHALQTQQQRQAVASVFADCVDVLANETLCRELVAADEQAAEGAADAASTCVVQLLKGASVNKLLARDRLADVEQQHQQQQQLQQLPEMNAEAGAGGGGAAAAALAAALATASEAVAAAETFESELLATALQECVGPEGRVIQQLQRLFDIIYTNTTTEDRCSRGGGGGVQTTGDIYGQQQSLMTQEKTESGGGPSNSSTNTSTSSSSSSLAFPTSTAYFWIASLTRLYVRVGLSLQPSLLLQANHEDPRMQRLLQVLILVWQQPPTWQQPHPLSHIQQGHPPPPPQHNIWGSGGTSTTSSSTLVAMSACGADTSAAGAALRAALAAARKSVEDQEEEVDARAAIENEHLLIREEAEFFWATLAEKMADLRVALPLLSAAAAGAAAAASAAATLTAAQRGGGAAGAVGGGGQAEAGGEGERRLDILLQQSARAYRDLQEVHLRVLRLVIPQETAAVLRLLREQQRLMRRQHHSHFSDGPLPPPLTNSSNGSSSSSSDNSSSSSAMNTGNATGSERGIEGSTVAATRAAVLLPAAAAASSAVEAVTQRVSHAMEALRQVYVHLLIVCSTQILLPPWALLSSAGAATAAGTSSSCSMGDSYSRRSSGGGGSSTTGSAGSPLLLQAEAAAHRDMVRQLFAHCARVLTPEQALLQVLAELQGQQQRLQQLLQAQQEQQAPSSSSSSIPGGVATAGLVAGGVVLSLEQQQRVKDRLLEAYMVAAECILLEQREIIIGYEGGGFSRFSCLEGEDQATTKEQGGRGGLLLLQQQLQSWLLVAGEVLSDAPPTSIENILARIAAIWILEEAVTCATSTYVLGRAPSSSTTSSSSSTSGPLCTTSIITNTLNSTNAVIAGGNQNIPTTTTTTCTAMTHTTAAGGREQEDFERQQQQHRNAAQLQHAMHALIRQLLLPSPPRGSISNTTTTSSGSSRSSSTEPAALLLSTQQQEGGGGDNASTAAVRAAMQELYATAAWALKDICCSCTTRNKASNIITTTSLLPSHIDVMVEQLLKLQECLARNQAHEDVQIVVLEGVSALTSQIQNTELFLRTLEFLCKPLVQGLSAAAAPEHQQQERDACATVCWQLDCLAIILRDAVAAGVSMSSSSSPETTSSDISSGSSSTTTADITTTTPTTTTTTTTLPSSSNGSSSAEREEAAAARRASIAVFVTGTLWPLLLQQLQLHPDNQRIVEKSLRCLKHAVRCAGSAFTPQLPLLLQLLQTNAQRRLHCTYLYAAEWLAMQYAGEQAFQEPLLRMFQQFSLQALELIEQQQQSGGGIDQCCDIIEDCYGMINRFTRYCPALVAVSAHVVRKALVAAGATIYVQERKAVEAVFIFLDSCVLLCAVVGRALCMDILRWLGVMRAHDASADPHNTRDQLSVALQPTIEEVLPYIIEECFRLLSQAPSNEVLRSLESFLTTLLQTLHWRAESWLARGLAQVPTAALSTEAMRRSVLERLLKSDYPSHSVREMIADIAYKCRQIALRNRA